MAGYFPGSAGNFLWFWVRTPSPCDSDSPLHALSAFMAVPCVQGRGTWETAGGSVFDLSLRGSSYLLPVRFFLVASSPNICVDLAVLMDIWWGVIKGFFPYLAAADTQFFVLCKNLPSLQINMKKEWIPFFPVLIRRVTAETSIFARFPRVAVKGTNP